MGAKPKNELKSKVRRKINKAKERSSGGLRSEVKWRSEQ